MRVPKTARDTSPTISRRQEMLDLFEQNCKDSDRIDCDSIDSGFLQILYRGAEKFQKYTGYEIEFGDLLLPDLHL